MSFADLSLRVACELEGRSAGNSFIAQQYASYPFRLSGNLRLDPDDPHRVYAYMMNAGPGILSGDDLLLSINVGDRARVYLTDQSATKVHSRPVGGPAGKIICELQVGADAYLEYIPEPIILFKASALSQETQMKVHPRGQLVFSEIVVPGRLARGELYAFEAFQSRLRIQTPAGKLCFSDNFRLLGQANRFRQSPIFSDFPIMGNFIVVVPGIALKQLSQQLQNHAVSPDMLQVCDSPLPGCHGLLVRAIATHVSALKVYQRHLLSCVRQLTGQPPIPSIPK